METTTKTNKLETKSILEFCKENNLMKLSNVILGNTNGYPYIMFSTGEPNVQGVPVYFSKNAALLVRIGEPITKEIVQTFRIAEDVKNKNGEERIKLVSNSNLDIEDLLAA